MKILIDADGCPVVNQTITIAQKYQTAVFILCDTAHTIQKEGATTLTVSKGADSVDFALLKLLSAGDLVITQDYGLAALCLVKHAQVLNQDGFIYTADNIDSLLLLRHNAKKIRHAGGKLKGPKKRNQQQNKNFERSLRKLLNGESQ